MEQEYLSVRQFAKRAGVTTQRIYQMMNKSLKSYCKVEDGKKYISADGLKIFERAEMEKKINQTLRLNNCLMKQKRLNTAIRSRTRTSRSSTTR